MEIGLGLPTSVPGTAGRDLLNWAVEGERAGLEEAGCDEILLMPCSADVEQIKLLSAVLARNGRE
jgi:hypothetical protein